MNRSTARQHPRCKADAVGLPARGTAPAPVQVSMHMLVRTRHNVRVVSAYSAAAISALHRANSFDGALNIDESHWH